MADLSSILNLMGTVSDHKDALASGTKMVAGLFGKKTKSQSKDSPEQGKYSPALERMITIAIEDGEINDDDLEILLKKAEKEGIDPDEFKFELRRRIKEDDKSRLINPVEALSNALRAIDGHASSSESIDGGSLSTVLTLIPGVGQAAAIGGLVASFIESPSKRNELKSEIIRLFILPDNAEYLQQFIYYANSQLIEEHSKKSNKKSIKGVISSLTMGDELNLVPIWEIKLEEACEKATFRFPDNAILSNTVEKYRPTLINKLRNGWMSVDDLASYQGPMPKFPGEAVAIVEMLYALKQSGSKNWDELKPVHAKFYSHAENIVAKGDSLYQRLIKCKVKKFGIF